VLVIATDMRALRPSTAAAKSALLTNEILELEPELIFKKVDSVLRGNIGPELEAQMRVEHKPSALLIPANPSRNRTIADGVYFVEDTPVAESGFAIEGNMGSSRVVDILTGRGTSNAICISLSDTLHETGVHIGNTQSAEELSAWAARINDDLVPAGAADFFAALLDLRSPDGTLNGAEHTAEHRGRRLYLCGSSFPSSRRAVSKAIDQGVRISPMPDDLYYSSYPDSEALDRWAIDVVAALATNDDVIVTAPQLPGSDNLSGRQISAAMAEVVRKAVLMNAFDELMIEGGATSQAVMVALGVDCLCPIRTIAPGVTRMQVDSFPNLKITTKPGSYRWPNEIWDFNN